MATDERQIRIRIKPGGAVEIEVDGVKGAQCANLTAALETALGRVTDKQLKPAYYEKEEEIVQIKPGQTVQTTLGNKPKQAGKPL